MAQLLKSLDGVSVVVTRARHQAGVLADLLTAEGARVTTIPLIEVRQPSDNSVALFDALSHMGDYDWLVFTSVNAVSAFFNAVEGSRSALLISPPQFAAIGEATARALSEGQIEPDLVVKDSTGAEFAAAFPEGMGRLLLPQSERAGDVVSDALVAKGWKVEVVPAYRVVDVMPGPDELQDIRKSDVIIFTSPSTVESFVATAAIADVPTPKVVAAIGPTTAERALSLGISVDVVPDHYSAEGLIQALVAFWSS